jgi:hypothetical protein
MIRRRLNRSPKMTRKFINIGAPLNQQIYYRHITRAYRLLQRHQVQLPIPKTANIHVCPLLEQVRACGIAHRTEVPAQSKENIGLNACRSSNRA